MGDPKQAQEDVDRARAEIKLHETDALFDRSMGVGLDITEAYIARLQGHRDKARELTDAAFRRRPYIRALPAAAMLAAGADDYDGFEPMGQAAARLNPAVVDTLFTYAVREARWQKAVDYFGQLEPPSTREHVGSGVTGYDVDRVDHTVMEAFWLTHGCEYAYALAALGKGAEARAALAEVRGRLSAAIAPSINPSTSGLSVAQQNAALARANADAQLSKAGSDALAKWTEVIERRIQADEGKAAEVVAGLDPKKPLGGLVGKDLAEALARNLPESDTASRAKLAALAPYLRIKVSADPKAAPPPPPLVIQTAKSAAGANGADGKPLPAVIAPSPPPPPAPADYHGPPVIVPSPPPPPGMRPDSNATRLFRALPDVETKGQLVQYKTSSSGFWLRVGEDGYTVSTGAQTPVGKAAGVADQDVTSVRYRGTHAASTVNEEMALLRAADVARRQGKKGMIVIGRTDVRHTTNLTTQYGGVTRSDPNGFETTLDVVFVDPANLPARYAKAAWRVIDADAVYAALAPLYIDTTPDAAPAKKR
jgi:hypothetical protein